LYDAGSKDVPLGKVLAILVEEEEDIAAFADYVAEESAAPAAPTPAAATPAAATPAAAPKAASPAAPAKASGDRIFVSPLA
jgi:pyruvate dehydrogenase E2 component (dihydrolipoamide acetyltransferase)